MKFDWIDFSLDADCTKKRNQDFREFHASTASSFSQALRGREFPKGKIFVHLTQNSGIRVSETADVFHIDATFDLGHSDKLGHEGALAYFCTWLGELLSSPFVNLCTAAESREIASSIISHGYEYIREEKLKYGCRVLKSTYRHTPHSVTARFQCSCCGKSIEVPQGPIARHELFYGNLVDSFMCDGDILSVDTFVGRFLSKYSDSKGDRA